MNDDHNFTSLIKIYSSYLLKKVDLGYYPIKLWIEVTNHCNLKCRLCPNREIPISKKGYMEWDLFKKIIDDAEGKVREINLFHRGESLLHPEIFNMIEYASSKGLITRIHTNATLLKSSIIEKILDSKLSYISFSFDGYVKSTYEKNRVNSSYEEALNGIINFLIEKKKKNKLQPYTVLQIMEYDNQFTKRDFKIQRKKFINTFKSLPLNRIVIRTPHNWGGLLKLGNKSQSTKKRPISCTFPWYALVILYDGKVVPCPQDFNARLIVGDIREQSLENIFNGKELRELRLRFRNRNITSLSPCINCDRIYRKTFLGLPTDYLSLFLRDSILSLRFRK